jgi:two-component sensor histidine kinase
VGPKAATALALVFHETATNAIKYGALSAPTGRITVTCDIQPDATLICWTEKGGPEITAAPERRGFGSSLAERIARGQLGRSYRTRMASDGLKMSLRVAMEQLAN